MEIDKKIDNFKKSLHDVTGSTIWDYKKIVKIKKEFIFGRSVNGFLKFGVGSDSDGKVSIVVGKKGSGKTSIGELFQTGYFFNNFKIIRFDIEGEAYANKKPNIRLSKIVKNFGWNPVGLPVKIYAPASKENSVVEKKRKQIDVWFKISSKISLEDWNILLNLTPEMQRLFKVAYLSLQEEERNFQNIYEAIKKNKTHVKNFVLTRMDFIEDLLSDGEDALDFEIIGNKKNEITVFDLSMIEGEETLMRGLIAFISKKFYKLKENGLIPSFLLILDEAHRFISKNPNELCTKTMLIVTKQGRKRNIHFICLTQKISDINEAIFSETDCYIILRITHGGDRRFLIDSLGLTLSLEQELLITKLKVGEALVYYRDRTNFAKLCPSPCAHKI